MEKLEFRNSNDRTGINDSESETQKFETKIKELFEKYLCKTNSRSSGIKDKHAQDYEISTIVLKIQKDVFFNFM